MGDRMKSGRACSLRGWMQMRLIIRWHKTSSSDFCQRNTSSRTEVRSRKKEKKGKKKKMDDIFPVDQKKIQSPPSISFANAPLTHPSDVHN